MEINFFAFTITCLAMYAATVFLAGCAYDSDKFSPCAILLATMGMTIFVTASFVYVAMIVFGD